MVHECHPLLAGLIEDWVHGTYIPFFQLACSAPGKSSTVTPHESTTMKAQKSPEQRLGKPLFGLLQPLSHVLLSVATEVSGAAQGPTMQRRDLWQGETAVLPAALQQ